jgi:DNA-binding FrmR family transcriptional regulator
MSVDNSQKISLNYKKAAGIINKIVAMQADKAYCIDIMQQNLAVIGLLKSAHQMLMADHLHNCFKTAMNSQNEKRKQEMIEEILKVTSLNK